MGCDNSLGLLEDLNEKTMKKKEEIIYGYVKTFVTIVLCTLTVLLHGCNDDDNNEHPAVVDRVLLVYLGGDNNLSGESYDKFEVIRRGWKPTAGSRILVYHDATDATPLLLEIGGQTIEQYEPENSADPAVFRRVIAKAKSLYPQARFNLLVFSHASGWLPQGAYSDPRLCSIITDNKHEMELKDFAAAIPNGMFGCIFFETCFMAGIETAYELKDKTRYIAASSAEILSPGFTALYEKHVYSLLNDDPREFIRAAFSYFDNQAGYMRSATFSVTDTQQLDALAAYVKAHCDLAKEVPIDEIQYFDRYNSRLFCDFGDYYSRLLETDQQKQQQQSLIDACVVWKASTSDFMLQYGGFDIEKHSGLTAYIRQDRYPKLNNSYTALSWYKRVSN